MKKISKAFLFAFLSALILVLLLGVAVWFQRNQLKQYAVNQLNNQLLAPVSVQSIDISFFDQFPKVSLRFNEVSIADPIRAKHELIEAKHIFVAFNIYDILTKNYHIKLIEADSGVCNIYIDSKGRANYHILKPSPSDDKDLFLKLSSVKMKGMTIRFQNREVGFELVAKAHKAEFSGDFKGKKEALALKGDFAFHKMVTGTTALVKNKEVTIDAGLKIDETKKELVFDKSKVSVGALQLSCSGNIGYQHAYTMLNIQFGAPDIRITDLLELIPGTVSKHVADYQSTGVIYFNGNIKGKVGANYLPEMKVQFGVENGTLTASKSAVTLSDIQCKGEFVSKPSGNRADGYLILPVMSFKLGGGSFSGALDIHHFNNPIISLALKGQAPVESALKFLPNQWIEKADGQLLVDLALNGSLKQLQSSAGFSEAKTSGKLECHASNIVLKNQQKTIESLDAVLMVNQKDLVIDKLEAKMNQSDIKVAGLFKNMIPFLLGTNQLLTADITYRSSKLDIENFIFPVATTSSTTESGSISLPDNIFVDANIDIDELVFHAFKARKVHGKINWKGKRIQAQTLTAETFNGKITVNGQLENAANGNFVVSTGIQFAQVDMDELFRQCNNFGQTELTHKHVKGKMQGMIDLAGVWNAKLVCDLNKLSVLSGITIKQGELNQYQPLDALSKYVRLEDLRNLKFADLTNQIEIRKGIITIPEMVVNNNALNITVSGTHTFSNYLDYHFKIKLNELLAKKFKQRNNEFEEESTDRGTNLFVSMKGPIDKLEFSYDKKKARAQVKQDITKEREAVKKVWLKELGLDKDETIKEKTTDSDELEFETE